MIPFPQRFSEEEEPVQVKQGFFSVRRQLEAFEEQRMSPPPLQAVARQAREEDASPQLKQGRADVVRQGAENMVRQ